jgi:GT2 family glycosyltransferase
MPDIICDLVLLSWNHLEQTRPCLESLFATTDVPSRLFIVDNGSEPEVRAFLKGVRPQGAIQDVVLLQNDTNEGFPRGMNRGIRSSSAPFVCLLNNDLRFTQGWLTEMIEAARAHPDAGLINPASNNFGNVPPAGMPLEAYAGRLRPLRGEITEMGMCVAFCMLITRGLIERIGLLSEEVERIFFEDEDYGARAQQAGFRCVVAESSYVWHAEHQTVRRMPERDALFAKNRRWCNERWGRWVRMAWPRFDPVVPGSDELRRWLEDLVSWARRRTHVYVYSPTPPMVTVRDLFRSVGLVPHVDVHWHSIPPRVAPWIAGGLILKRRKKPFDIIVSPDPGWARGMARWRWWHRADIVWADDEEQLTAQWKAKSRSLS